jgi:hypothetical protein
MAKRLIGWKQRWKTRNFWISHMDKSLGYPIWIKVHINVKIKSLGYPYGYPK